MPGFTDYWARKVLDHSTGKTSIGTAPTVSIGLFTSPPTDAGGGTEVSGGSYARKTTAATDWNAASGSGPASTSNAQDLAFPTPTADWAPISTPVVAFGAFDAASGGNLLWWDWLGNYPRKPFTADTGDLITSPGHGYAAGDAVVFTAEYGGSLPTGLSADTVYFVIASGLTSDAFKVSTTQGGSAVDLTAAGAGMVRKIDRKVIQTGDTVKFAGGSPGNLVVTQA